MASVPVTALKKNEEGIVDSLKNADLECLSEDALEIGVIPQDVRDAVGSMDWDHVRRPRVIRYLLVHVYRAIEDSPRLYERWLHVLSKHVATVEVLDKVRERHGFLMQRDNLLAHTEDLPEEVGIPAKRPRLQSENLFMEQHIPKLTDVLVSCAAKYMEMSIMLGLPEHVRKDLSRMFFTESCFAAFSRLLREWIVGRHRHACDPTLENLERALRSEVVGMGYEANQLKDNLYNSGITFKTDEQNPMSQAKLLHCEVLPLDIVRQSRDTKVTEGKTTLLEVQAVTSRDYITYQWMKDGCPLEDTNLCQRYNNILCIRDCDQSSNSNYTCELSDGLNTCSSRPITLTVNISSVRKALVDRYSTQPEVPAASHYGYPPQMTHPNPLPTSTPPYTGYPALQPSQQYSNYPCQPRAHPPNAPPSTLPYPLSPNDANNLTPTANHTPSPNHHTSFPNHHSTSSIESVPINYTVQAKSSISNCQDNLRMVSHLKSQHDSHLHPPSPPNSEHPLQSASVELKTLRACTGQLETALKREERDLVHFLNVSGFISEDVYDIVLNPLSMLSEVQKAGELVKGIKWRVEQDRASYHELVAKLKDFGKVYKPVLRALEAEHTRQLGSQGT